MKREENIKRYVQLIIPVIKKTGISQLKMDNVAAYMEISKATLYKYFSTKDELIGTIVDEYISYFDEGDKIVLDHELDYPSRFIKIFEASLTAAIYISDIFINDLKKLHPELYERILEIYRNRANKLEAFIHSGIKDGVFNEIDATLFMMQDEVMLRRIIDPAFSVQYDMTLKQALFNYYNLKKHQLFKGHLLDTIDETEIQRLIPYYVQKISQQI
ncbi:TetR/AcrR family transcriptional regulator [Paenibacillus sp. NPDC058071]|uniref:TetR/AcrR family transcriptional regulator n=1 Tax=Paenibacillus sp. NPDC058071 TaxID=3346326 RepID=UPI0036DE0C5E